MARPITERAASRDRFGHPRRVAVAPPVARSSGLLWAWPPSSRAQAVRPASKTLILSLSLGGARYFGWRPRRRRGGSPGRVRLGHSDIATMEGWTQYYYEHGVLDAAPTAGPRINLTWRWIARHEHAHPNSATTAE